MKNGKTFLLKAHSSRVEMLHRSLRKRGKKEWGWLPNKFVECRLTTRSFTEADNKKWIGKSGWDREEITEKKQIIGAHPMKVISAYIRVCVYDPTTFSSSGETFLDWCAPCSLGWLTRYLAKVEFASLFIEWPIHCYFRPLVNTFIGIWPSLSWSPL